MPDTPTPNVAALVLAAGKSTRMRSRTPKGLHPLLGKPLLRWALDAVHAAGAARTVLVVGHQSEQVQTALGPGYEYVHQHDQRGTGHAVQQAQPLLADWPGVLLVVPGDAPLLTADLLRALLAHHHETNAAATLLTAHLDDPAAYGRILRDPHTGHVRAIVEARDATPAQLELHEIATSVYAFQPAALFDALRRITPHNAQGELYLTDAIALLSADGLAVRALVAPDADAVQGVNTRAELLALSQTVQSRIHAKLMSDGVSILDPASTHIDATVTIGPDTVVHPFTTISGVTDIGPDCVIGPGARISDSRLGASVVIRDSWVIASDIGDATKIGPFAHIRPDSHVGIGVKIGNFVELKKATLGDHVSAGHLSYLGDADIGPGVNIGAGTITCNYDPFRTPTKNRTTVGADAFIGTHSTLVAPVTIGDAAYTAAGSVITHDVPADALAFGRARQTNKPGWVSAKKRRKTP